MSFWAESKSWFKIQGVRPLDEQWSYERPGFRWQEPSDGPLSAHLFQGISQRFSCASLIFHFRPSAVRSSGAGCPCPRHLRSICCAGQRGLIAAGNPVSERSYVTAANAPLTPWNLAIKPAKTLQYFSPFPWDCNVSHGSNLLTSFVLGAWKHCSTLTPLPGKVGLTFRNFCVSFSYFRVISMLANMHSF